MATAATVAKPENRAPYKMLEYKIAGVEMKRLFRVSKAADDRRDDARSKLLRVLAPRDVTSAEFVPAERSHKFQYVLFAEQPGLAMYLLWCWVATPDSVAYTRMNCPVGVVALLQVLTAAPGPLRQRLADEFVVRYLSYVDPWEQLRLNVEAQSVKKLNEWQKEKTAAVKYGRDWWTAFHKLAKDVQYQNAKVMLQNATFQDIPYWTANVAKPPDDVPLLLSPYIFFTDAQDAALEAKSLGPQMVFPKDTLYVTHTAVELGEGSVWQTEIVPTMRAGNEVRALLRLEGKPGARTHFPEIKAIDHKAITVDIATQRALGQTTSVSLAAVLASDAFTEDLDAPQRLAFCTRMGKALVDALRVLHREGIGHHRLRLEAMRFPGTTMADIPSILAGAKGAPILTDFSAARYYLRPEEEDADDGKDEEEKEPDLVPVCAVLPSSITCRSWPKPKAEAEADTPWPPPPELSLAGEHVTATRWWPKPRPQTPPKPQYKDEPYLLAEMGLATDLWDAAVVIAQLFGFTEPGSAPMEEAQVAAWLAQNADKPQPVRDLLPRLLRANGAMRVLPKDITTFDAPMGATSAGSSAGYSAGGAGFAGGSWEEAGGGGPLTEDLLLPCPESMCHPAYADHQRLVAENRRLKAQLRHMTRCIRQAADRL